MLSEKGVGDGITIPLMIKRPRRLDGREIDALLALEVPAHLATLDRNGFPHITPLWFVWEDGAFYMTSIVDRPHLKRLARDPRAGLGIDIEDAERVDGQRPNRQVRQRLAVRASRYEEVVAGRVGGFDLVDGLLVVCVGGIQQSDQDADVEDQRSHSSRRRSSSPGA